MSLQYLSDTQPKKSGENSTSKKEKTPSSKDSKKSEKKIERSEDMSFFRRVHL
ncbi:MAG: hypothetical protein KDC84_04900 [Crocinitomicaceae bacterium]|nr:hypothetical protein [Crocinitomicaceae bacterium]